MQNSNEHFEEKRLAGQAASAEESHCISLVADWVDSRHPDSSTDGAQAATSAEDLLAVYKCFDFLERVWPTDFEGPTRAGPFTLEKEIGRGGMGLVWSAQQFEPVSRKVAVKLITPGPQSSQMVRRFESERKVLARMNHPGIATLIDAGRTDDGQLYFAMELVEGPNLVSYCEEHSLSIKDRLTLFLDACSAVQHAHQKGIVHRDIKPNNILVGQVDDQPHVKVIDFGLSKSDNVQNASEPNSHHRVSELGAMTLDGQVIGTLRYMSPEQAAGDTANIDVRSDIYSLGTVLYKLLTDVTPLDTKKITNASPERYCEAIQFEPDIKPSQWLETLERVELEQLVANRKSTTNRYRRDLKSDLDWIVMRAIEKGPHDRYSSVSDFAADIRRYLADQPVVARPQSRLYSIKKEFSRNRVLWTSLSGIVFALVAGILVSSYGLATATSARHLAEKRLEHSRKSNEILADIFAEIDVYDIEMETEPFKMVVGRRLVATASRLNEDTIGDPLEVAKIQVKLAQTLNNLEFFNDAIPISRDALEIVSEQQPTDDLKFQAGIALAKALRGSGRTAEASDTVAPLLEESLTIEGDNGENYLALLLTKGIIATAQYRHREARQCLTHVADCREKLWGKLDLRTLEAKYWLADVQFAPGETDAALKLYEEVLEAYRELLPTGHPRTIKAMLNYAWRLSNEGEFSEAHVIADEGLVLARETYGKDHPTTYDALLTLGLIAHRKGNFSEGASLLERAWDGLSETAGLSHPRALRARTILADMSLQIGEYKRGIDLLQEARKHSRYKRRIDFRLATVYNDVGEFTKARQLLESLIADSDQAPDAQQTVFNCRYEIGRSWLLEENYVEAVEVFEASLQLLPTTIVRHDFPFMRSTLSLARAHSKNGNHDKAKQIITDYVESLPDSPASTSMIRLCCKAEMGLALRQEGQFEQAIEQMMSVVRTGKTLLHQDLLIRELRLAQTQLGEKSAVLSAMEREMAFWSRRFPAGSLALANRLKSAGEDLIVFQLPDKAIEVLRESAAILEDIRPNSWSLTFVKFNIARLVMETAPSDSEVGRLAAIELEETWQQLAKLKPNAFPTEIKALIEPITSVMEVYRSEFDSNSEQLWTSRLESL